MPFWVMMAVTYLWGGVMSKAGLAADTPLEARRTPLMLIARI